MAYDEATITLAKMIAKIGDETFQTGARLKRDQVANLNGVIFQAKLVLKQAYKDKIEAERGRFARIVGRPGMCSDDGRAITYYWTIYSSKDEAGNWDSRQENVCADTEDEAKAYCSERGFILQGTSWT